MQAELLKQKKKEEKAAKRKAELEDAKSATPEPPSLANEPENITLSDERQSSPEDDNDGDEAPLLIETDYMIGNRVLNAADITSSRKVSFAPEPPAKRRRAGSKPSKLAPPTPAPHRLSKVKKKSRSS